MTAQPVEEESALLTATDIARWFGVTPGAVTHWVRRNADFPKPALRVNGGRTPLWTLGDITEWFVSHPHRTRPLD